MSLKNSKQRRTSNISEQENSSVFSGASLRLIFSLVIAAFCILFSLAVLLIQRAEASSAKAADYLRISTAATVFLLFLLIAFNVIFYAVELRRESIKKKEQAPHQHFPIGMLNKLSQPAIMFDTNGNVVWANASFCGIAPRDIIVNAERYKFRTLFEPRQYVEAQPSENSPPVVSSAGVEELFEYMADHNAAIQAIGRDTPGGDWVLHSYRHRSNDGVYYMIVLTNVTELVALKESYRNDRPMCAYIVIDNLEELVSREQESYRRASANVDSIIKAWASELDAVIKEYERDKYIMLFKYSKMKEITPANGEAFRILERVREIKVGKEELSVTVSIGVSKPTGSLLEKERSAQVALDTALKRGGNQAVVYTSDTEFKSYGAKDEYKPQTYSSVHTRVFADRLCAEMRKEECKHVIIMGHRNPDFDAIGSCIGIARLAMAYKKDVKLIINANDPSVSEALSRIRMMPEYELLFKDYMDGLDKLPNGSILVCCDVNNFKQFESPELATNADTMFIIDHHRTNEFTPTLTPEMATLKHYDFLIVPSASSASELVSEILEYSLTGSDSLAPEEADLLFAGLLLDTKQFTRNAQAPTFSAALYLRNCGADPTRAQALFKTELTDYQMESEFGTDVYLEREFIAIAKEKGDSNSPNKRIAAAKTADRLLNIKNIRASFAVAKMGDDVFISARSDGSVNVQLIMEALGGGGHYNAAATMLKESTVDLAIAKLGTEIKRYFGEIYDSTTRRVRKDLTALVKGAKRNKKK